jgi:pimeloyl-ACP methyl ester carboxylesterase
VGTLVAGEHWHWAYQALFAYDHPKNVHALTCPIYLVTGDKDRIAVVMHEQAAHNLPDARVYTPKDRGVDYMDTYATEFAPHLLEFINSVR